uniref:Uncharacterized protein n=1 Tax=Caenorhabditis japonica TaxID=281687 RepID=A0A8R1IU68_CAEJA
STSILAWLLSAMVTVMILFFFLSIVNSLAKDYHKRLWDRKRAQNKVEVNRKNVQDLIDEENLKISEEDKEEVEEEEEDVSPTPPSNCPLLLSDGEEFEGVLVVKN